MQRVYVHTPAHAAEEMHREMEFGAGGHVECVEKERNAWRD